MRARARVSLIAGLLSCALLGGCIVTPAESPEVVTYSPPPPVRYEAIGVAPSAGYFWVGGAWFWEGGRYAWHPGYWQAPRPGYHWVPHTWHPVGNTWHMQPGHWARR